MENYLSYVSLIVLSLLSIFLYTRKYLLLQLLPAAVLIGLVFLFFNNQNIFVQKTITQSWSVLPTILINVVFASLFIGKKIMSPKAIWKFAGPQIVLGQTFAWGQYVVGALVVLAILIPVFNFSPLSAALIEISFEGGHGTAAGLGGLFQELNFADGMDMALGLATVGLITGLFSGLFFIAVYRRKNAAKHQHKGPNKKPKRPVYSDLQSFLIKTHNSYFSHHVVLRTLTQLGLIGLAIAIGFLIKELLIFFEVLVFEPLTGLKFFSYIPLFPLAMLGGVIVQIALYKLRLNKMVHPKTILFIGNFALEMVIISAIASISIVAVTNNLGPFIILALAGISYNVFVLLAIAPKLMKRYWFERSVGDYGQSIGMTATGLVLMKAADPTNKSEAVERFGYKQLMFEPIVGGGLFTAISMIIIAQFGLSVLLIIAAVMLVFWLTIGYLAFATKHR